MIRLLVRFLAKRAMVLGMIAAAAGFFISDCKIAVPFGLLLGMFVSICKTKTFASFLINLAGASGVHVKSAMYQVFSNLLVFGLLIVAVIADTELFFGVSAGLLVVPSAILINAFTEQTGLTHNRWGEVEERSES